MFDTREANHIVNPRKTKFNVVKGLAQEAHMVGENIITIHEPKPPRKILAANIT